MHIIDVYGFFWDRTTVRNEMNFFIKCLFTFTFNWTLRANLASSTAACIQCWHVKKRQTSTFVFLVKFQFTLYAQLSTLCLENFNDTCGLSGAQEPGEGVLGHQVVDPLLCGVESVGTHRVHHTQQSLASFCIQVYLRAKVPLHHRGRALVLFCPSAPTSCGASGLMNWLQMLLALVLEGAPL